MGLYQLLRQLRAPEPPPKLDKRIWHVYHQQNGIFPGYDKPRSANQLQKDVNCAHDHIRLLVQTNDALMANLMYERAWRKLLMWALGATWTGIGGLLAYLIPFAVKGMAR
jgi:hypothetical protein